MDEILKSRTRTARAERYKNKTTYAMSGVGGGGEKFLREQLQPARIGKFGLVPAFGDNDTRVDTRVELLFTGNQRQGMMRDPFGVAVWILVGHVDRGGSQLFMRGSLRREKEEMRRMIQVEGIIWEVCLKQVQIIRGHMFVPPLGLASYRE